MVNYGNTKIYKIWSTQGDKVYIGSTTKEYLSQRMDTHRKEYKRWKNGNRDKITSYVLFEEYGVENCFIELIEAKACNNSDEKNKLEGGYIRSMECVNKVMLGRTQQEYEIENKEKRKQYKLEHKEQSKQYYIDNKVKISEQKKQYSIDNKVKISEQRKQYRIDNKEKIKEQKKQSYLKSKKTN
jgi:hypothetical protein